MIGGDGEVDRRQRRWDEGSADLTRKVTEKGLWQFLQATVMGLKKFETFDGS